MDCGFIAVERFIPFQEYKDWCKLYHVLDVVSIDLCLCPMLFRELSDEDYNHTVWMDGYPVFDDLKYLLNKGVDHEKYQILALLIDPIIDCSGYVPDKRFHFYGYDLVNSSGISALTNCGGFDNAFLPSDLSPFGLIEDYQTTLRIQNKLLEEYPDEDDADCSIWAIWRMEE